MHLLRLNLLLCAAGLAVAAVPPVRLHAQTPPATGPAGPAGPAASAAAAPAAPAAAVVPAAAASVDETSPEYIAAHYLGERFTSRAAGISLRPPLNGTQIKPRIAGANVVQYVNADEKWSLRVTHMVLEKPQPLVGVDDPSTPRVDESKANPGVLDQVIQQIITQNAGTQVLRRDTINVGPHDAGLLIARYAQATQMFLRQMAIIQRSHQDYYVLDLTTPSTRTAADAANVVDPGEAMAVRIFRSILDSVQLLDMHAIVQERDQRSYNAIVALVNLPRRLKAAAQAEQYFRVQRDGRDIGWSYVTEEFGDRQGESGFYSAVLSQVTPEAGTKIDTASEMFCADGRRGEAWVSISVVEKDGKTSQTSEYGQAERLIKRKMVEKEGGDAKDKGNPVVSQSRQDRLLVTQTTSAGVIPTQRDLPPFYIQQALSSMLPRLLPLNQATGYAFSVWVGSERELVLRYLDVEAPRTVNFAGQNVMVIPVKDRLGLDGDPTYHYITPDGKYLGSSAPGGVNIIATDQKTLGNLYPSANFARPKVLEAGQK